MTTHDDLIEHGGNTCNFELCIDTGKSGRSCDTVLRFYSSLNPSFHAPFELNNERWTIYAKIEQIFRTRTNKLKNLAESINRPFLYGLYGALPTLGFITIPTLCSLIILPTMYKFKPYCIIAILSFVVVYTPVFVLIRALGRTDRVYLRYRREDQKAKEATRKEWIGKLVMIVIGAIVGIAGTLLADYLKH